MLLRAAAGGRFKIKKIFNNAGLCAKKGRCMADTERRYTLKKFNNAGLFAKKKVGAWPIQSAGEDGGE